MFKRKPRSYSQRASDMVYPRGGWLRAGQYALHRLRRLPDAPHRIGRGVAAGVLMSFTPLFGLHLLGSMALAWAVGGNVLASVIGSFAGNPLTIPIIAVMSLRLGRWMLGIEGSMAPAAIFEAFAAAGRQLAHNTLSVLDHRVAEWDRLANFAQTILLPYAVGGLLPGLVAAILAHSLTVPLVEAYHARRAAARARKARKPGTDAQGDARGGGNRGDATGG